MPVELLSSKVVVIEEEPRIAALPVVQTAVLGAIGKAVRGPLNLPSLINSFEEYTRLFGEYSVGFELPLAIRAFFLQGGRTAYAVRAGTGGTAALFQFVSGTPASGTILSSIAGPYDLEPGDTLDVQIDGGGTQTATFLATAGATESGNAQPFALANGDTLTVKIDGGSTQTITFLTGSFVSIGAATALEVAAVINAGIVGAKATVTSGGTKVTITSDKRGTASSVEVTGGTANAVGKLNFPTSVNSGTGNVANIDSVTAAEVAARLTASVAGASSVVEAGKVRITSSTTGVTSTVQVMASSTADDEIGFDNAIHVGSAGGVVNSFLATATSVGTWGNGIKVRIKDSSSGVASEFNLEIEVDGFLRETFANLTNSVDPAANFIETVINNPTTGSLYITVTSSALNRPNNTTSAGQALSGGVEPTVTDTELIGGTSPTLTGIRALDIISDVTILIVPDGPTIAVENAMIAYAEVTRNRSMFAILDPPAGASAATIVTHVESLTATEQAALYWPRLKIPNPSRRIYGKDVEAVTQTISGFIAGVCARNDASLAIGPFANPANIEDGRIFNVIDLETDEVLREEKRDLVFPKRVNPVVFVRSQGFFADGARTLLGTSNFPSIGERRGVTAIENLAKASLQFAKNKPNTEELRERAENTLISIVMPFVNAGALASRDPAKAFFVDVSEQLNSASVRAAGQLKARLGLATAKPAEFIILLVTQDTRALEEELNSQA
jgi:hypothetical protein